MPLLYCMQSREVQQLTGDLKQAQAGRQKLKETLREQETQLIKLQVTAAFSFVLHKEEFLPCMPSTSRAWDRKLIMPTELSAL